MTKLIRQLRSLLGIRPPEVDPTEAPPRFTTIRDVDGVIVVRFHNLNPVVLGMDNIERIESVSDELLSVADRNPLAVILDFEGTDFVAVAAFENVLVRLHKKLNGKLRMCNLPQSVAEKFQMIQLARLFQIHARLDDALADVKIPYLELPHGRRIPLVASRLLVGRIPFDEENHGNVLGITKQQARCEGEWLYLPDPHVSKQHAILARIDDSYAIEDTASTGGTFVNDQPITERTLLKPGDTIKVGKLKIVYGDEITKGLNFLWQRVDCD